MSDSVVGRGVIELVADARKLKAGIDDAKKSIRTLGDGQKDVSKAAAASIDNYIGRLQMQQQTLGKSTRETELFKLAMRGASDEQLRAADASLKLTEAYQRGVLMGDKLKAGFLAIGTIAATGLIAAAVAFDHLAKSAGDFQDMAEKTGDTAENIASLAVAAKVGGVEMETVVGAANKLTKGLTGVDDESKAAGAAIAALGLNLAEFKQLKPADQMESVAKALDGFQDGAEKSAVAMALFGKSGAEMMPFLKELSGETGRQNILTSEQIQLADQYADQQAKLRAQISLHAQAIATELLPALNEFSSVIADLSKDQEFAATASETLKAAMSGALTVFQSTIILGSDVAFVFKMVGKEIGAISAQLYALGRGDLAAFSAISDAVKEDAAKARAELDRFQSSIAGIGTGTKDNKEAQQSDNKATDKPRLKYEGADKDTASKVAALAKSQMEYDLALISSEATKLTGIYSSAEKIMEATRSAGLIDEREYFAAKLGFLTINTQAQEEALQKELARMQAEKLSGKDKVDNDKKIIETQDKLNKLRESAAASATVLGIQEPAALKKIKLGYRDAEASAQAFFDTLARSNDRQLAGMGAGTQERDRLAGRAQQEDKYSEEIRQLNQRRQQAEFADTFGEDAQKKYDDELDRIKRFQALALAEYDKGYADRLKKQGDWSVGASEAMKNYYTESSNIMKQTEDVFTNAFKGMEDAMVSFTMTGKADFASLAKSIIANITRIIIKQQISNAIGVAGTKSSSGSGLMGLISAAASAYSGGGDSVTLSDGQTFSGRAIGGPVSAGGMYQVNEKGTPELLNVAGKQYLMMGNQSGSVDATGAGGGVNVSVAVDAKGSSVEGNTEQSKQLGQMIGSAVKGIIMQEKRAGGLLA